MPEHPLITRRRVLTLLGGAAALPVLSACGSSVGGGAEAPAGGDAGGGVKVGLVVPQSGVYAALGTDMQRGWELWLERNGGRLGTYAVETVIADEGETPQTGVPAVQKVLQSDNVDVVVGLVNSATALGVADLLTEAKKLLVVTNAGAADVTGKARTPYIWRTSFTNAQVAGAMGAYLAQQTRIKQGVYAIAPDYAAGTEVIGGFTQAFRDGGGTVVGEAKPAFGKTSDYQPFLAGIQASGARATFCFFSGAEAITFVRQYKEFGLDATIPLYGSGFLTEGSVLAQQADAALGVQTTLHYTDTLENPANAAFVEAYTAAYGESPSCFSAQSWDAANVLNRALASATALDGDALAAALGGVGTIDDSPRGPWTFDGQSPRQNIYLREVENVGGTFVNSVVQDLGPLSQPA